MSLPRRALFLVAALAIVGSLLPGQRASAQGRRRGAPILVPQQMPTGDSDKESGEFSHAISLPSDNGLKKQIEAAIDYIKTEDWVTACEVLQKLVTIREDVFVQLPRKGPATSVRAEANRLIATLPRKGLEFYKLTYNPPAQEMLKQARASSDVGLLAQVMRNYLHTDPGGEATNLLGTYHLDRGNFVTASLCFERLLHRDGADKLAPVTLFKAAYAFHQTGDRANEQAAWSMLESRVRDVAIGGEKKSIADLKQYVARLVRANAERNVNDWSMFGGTESRSGQGIGGPAFMEARMRFKTIFSDRTADWVRKAEQKLADRQQPVLSAFFPITVTVTQQQHKVPLLIFRSFRGIEAYDIKTGQMAWKMPSLWSIDGMVGDEQVGITRRSAIEIWVSYYLDQNKGASILPGILFENSTLGSLSTDNTFVFAIEDLAVPPPPPVQNGMPFNGFNHGGYNEEVQPRITHNELQAIELSTGKRRWILPDEKPEHKDLADCYFLGPPLPLAGKLYVLIEKQQELRLLCLDPTSGRVLSSQALANTRDKMSRDISRRTQAAHLAYGEGILVCPTNAGAMLGVDLLSNSLVWAYSYREKGQSGEDWAPGIGAGMGGRFARPGMLGPNGLSVQLSQTLNSQWKVSAPVIHDGKVVFAAPDGRHVHCLNLRDGTELWTQRRTEDDLYLAGVFSGKALIVGKKQVRAIALNGKGENAWTLETGLPSGQGIASDNIYYLPLKEAAQGKEPEICAIDMEAGRIVAHTKSRKHEIPGNLLFYEGDVLSQSPSEVAVYPQLKVKLAQIDELISKNPADPVGLTERGELRLDQGNLDGAIADLTTALKNHPPAETLAKTRAKLHETLTEYFQRDFNKAEPFLATYEQLCKVDLDGAATDEQKAERQAEARRRRANFLCLVAKGKEAQRKLVEAFEKYEEFAAITDNKERISVVDEPAVMTAPDVWSRGRILAMIASATEMERKPLEELVARKWQELKKKNDLNELRSFVNVFGSVFASGTEARLLLAERLINDAGPASLLEAERHLVVLRGPGEPPETAARAIEATARLYLARNLLPDAAHFYNLLGKDYRDVVIANGKKGSDFFDEMATDKRLQPYLDPPALFKARGKIKVSLERQNNGYASSGFQVYNFEQAGEPLPFFQMHRLGLVFIDSGHKFRLTDRTTGEERWNQPLPRTMFQTVINHMMQPGAARVAYQNLGHLVILPVGHMVFALDPVNRQLLWERNLLSANAHSATPNGAPAEQNFTLVVDPRDGTLQVLYTDGWMQRLGGIVMGSVLCLQTRDGLVAIDPVTNRTLWTRSDISLRSQIFGDDRHLYIVEMNNENRPTSSRALRADDGVTVHVPDFTAQYDKRQRVLGRTLLLSETDANSAVTLRLYDVLTGKDRWKETFPPNTTVLKSADPDLAGIIDPDGKVRVFDLQQGKEVMACRLYEPKLRDDMENVKKAQSVHLLSDGKDFFIAVNSPAAPNGVNGAIVNNFMPGAGLRTLPINGPVFCYSRQTGNFRWRTSVNNQMMVLDQFRELPMILFTSSYQNWVRRGFPNNPVHPATSVKSVDKATGKLLFDDEIQNANGLNFYALEINPRAGRVDLVGHSMRLVHQLNGDAVSAPNRVGAGSSIPDRPIREFRIVDTPALPRAVPKGQAAVPR